MAASAENTLSAERWAVMEVMAVRLKPEEAMPGGSYTGGSYNQGGSGGSEDCGNLLGKFATYSQGDGSITQRD